jgi:NAD(P)-dependent dehydrogenase (short-subunit alcohol dehydrogenase family)
VNQLKEVYIMKDKICLVTGATSGIGKATALGLARSGATVAIVGRDRVRGEAARDEIRNASGNPKVDLLLADLSSQAVIWASVEMVWCKEGDLSVGMRPLKNRRRSLPTKVMRHVAT